MKVNKRVFRQFLALHSARKRNRRTCSIRPCVCLPVRVMTTKGDHLEILLIVVVSFASFTNL